jgi:hypothetical protein
LQLPNIQQTLCIVQLYLRNYNRVFDYATMILFSEVYQQTLIYNYCLPISKMATSVGRVNAKPDSLFIRNVCVGAAYEVGDEKVTHTTHTDRFTYVMGSSSTIHVIASDTNQLVGYILLHLYFVSLGMSCYC